MQGRRNDARRKDDATTRDVRTTQRREDDVKTTQRRRNDVKTTRGRRARTTREDARTQGRKDARTQGRKDARTQGRKDDARNEGRRRTQRRRQRRRPTTTTTHNERRLTLTLSIVLLFRSFVERCKVEGLHRRRLFVVRSSEAVRKRTVVRSTKTVRCSEVRSSKFEVRSSKFEVVVVVATSLPRTNLDAVKEVDATSTRRRHPFRRRPRPSYPSCLLFKVNVTTSTMLLNCVKSAISTSTS